MIGVVRLGWMRLPAGAPRRRGARGLAWAALVLLPLAVIAAGPPAFTESDHAYLAATPPVVETLERSAPPAVDAASVLVLDANTGRIVWGIKPHLRWYPASTVKMMTALLAAQSGQLDRQIDFVPAMGADGSSAGLLPGDRLTMRDLLRAMLVPSGNEAANAIAYALGDGSIARFVAQMNEQAARWGLRDTRFVNPHGLDAPGEHTSAFDLATLALRLLADPLLAQIVATPRLDMRVGTRTLVLKSTNDLLVQGVPGVDGVKTGTEDLARENQVTSVTRDDHRVMIVVLGSNDRDPASLGLIDWAFSAFRWRDLGDGKPPVMLPAWLVPFEAPAEVLRAAAASRAGDEVPLP